MFNLPGLSSKGTAEQDVADLRKYLTMLIPQLEQELSNLSSDNFASDYNEILEGLQSAETIRDGSKADTTTTTSQALAAHLQNTKNPHKVTKEQLGITNPTLEELNAVPLHSMSGYNLLAHETNDQTVAAGDAILTVNLGGMQDGDRLEGWLYIAVGTNTTVYGVRAWLDEDETEADYYGKHVKNGDVITALNIARATSCGCWVKLRLEKFCGAVMMESRYINATAEKGSASNSEVGFAQWLKKDAAGNTLTIKAIGASAGAEIALWRV